MGRKGKKPVSRKTSRKKPEKSAADRRERIISAALRLYVKNGVPGTRARDVATEAEVDPPLIHYYFPDSESLHLAVVRKVLESLKEYSLRGIAAHPDDPVVQMQEYLKAPLLWVRDEPQWMTLWMYFYYASSLPGRFREMNDQIRVVGRERIQNLIYRGLEKGVFRLSPDRTAATTALEIQSFLTGTAVMYSSESGVSFEELSRLTEERIFRMLGMEPALEATSS